MSEEFLDCKEAKCPKPIIMISQKMKGMEEGAALRVEATDPAFKPDLEAWAKRLGHEIREFEEGDVQRALVVKKA